jgi:hypothetical protein
VWGGGGLRLLGGGHGESVVGVIPRKGGQRERSVTKPVQNANSSAHPSVSDPRDAAGQIWAWGYSKRTRLLWTRSARHFRALGSRAGGRSRMIGDARRVETSDNCGRPRHCGRSSPEQTVPRGLAAAGHAARRRWPAGPTQDRDAMLKTVDRLVGKEGPQVRKSGRCSTDHRSLE